MSNLSHPYPSNKLSSTEVHLLRRVEILEATLAALLRTLGENLPSTRNAVTGINESIQNGLSIAHEMAAATYLESTDLRRHDIDLSAYELYRESEEAIQSIDALVAQYFPSMLGQPHPLRLLPSTVLPEDLPSLGEEQKLPTAEEIEQVETGFVRSLLLSTSGKAEPTLFVSAEQLSGEPAGPGTHTLAINQLNGRWTFAHSLLDGEQSRYFTHRQAQYVNSSQLATALRNALVKERSSKYRTYFKGDEDFLTKVSVLLTKIFEKEPVLNLEVGKEYLHAATLTAGTIQELSGLGKVVVIRSETSPLPIILSEKTPGKYLARMNNDTFSQFELAALVPQSQHVLLEWLTALSKHRG